MTALNAEARVPGGCGCPGWMWVRRVRDRCRGSGSGSGSPQWTLPVGPPQATVGLAPSEINTEERTEREIRRNFRFGKR